MKRCRIIVRAALLLAFASPVAAQGLLRSNGLGFRTGFWNMHGESFGVNVVTGTEGTRGNLSGLGLWLHYFSRVHNNWFLELNLGVAIRADFESSASLINETVDLDAVIPLLFGVRYDFLSLKIPSRFQPYLSAGGGPYWISSITSVSDADNTDIVSSQSNAELGVYLGGGINLPITSWFGFNFDLKYHFVDFSVSRGVSGPEIGLELMFMWGKKRELFRVKKTTLLVKDIYPAYYQFYNLYPLALVSVQNTAGFPIEVKVTSQVHPYSSRPKESEYVKIERGEIEDIPATAIFGPEISQIASREPAVLDIEVEGRAGTTYKKEISEQLTVHTRNAWDGSIERLSFFVTPDHAEIVQLSRRFMRDILNDESIEPQRRNFEAAKAIFNELGKTGIHYQADPNVPFYQDDRVQFALETLDLRSGDCDDLVVLYASLLESLGINTAFVQVQDPEKTLAHLYLMFDTDLSPQEGALVSSNAKRYVVREKHSGKHSIWIPVETTVIHHGFEEAWKAGTLEYLQEALLRNGLAEGWVQIIDVE